MHAWYDKNSRTNRFLALISDCGIRGAYWRLDELAQFLKRLSAQNRLYCLVGQSRGGAHPDQVVLAVGRSRGELEEVLRRTTDNGSRLRRLSRYTRPVTGRGIDEFTRVECRRVGFDDLLPALRRQAEWLADYETGRPEIADAVARFKRQFPTEPARRIRRAGRVLEGLAW